MDLQRLSDVLQSPHPVLQTDNVHAHRLTQIILKKMDESPIHNVLALRLTRSPLATCQVLKMESYEDPALHPIRDHSPVQAWHWKYHPHPRHVQTRLGCGLPCASKYRSLLGNGVPFPGFHVVPKQNQGSRPIYHYLQKMQHHRPDRSAWLDHRVRSTSRPVRSDLFQRDLDGYFRNHPRS